MPTRLGNVLRRAEDDAERLRHQEDRSDIQVSFFETMHLIPADLMAQHDLYRSRLDLYCTMWFVSLGLAVFGLITTVNNDIDLAVVPLLLLGASASYWAALGAADALGQVLRAAANVVRTTPIATPKPSAGP